MLDFGPRSWIEPTARHATGHRSSRQTLLPLLVVLLVLVSGTGVAAAAAYLKLNANLRGEQVDDRLGSRPPGADGGSGPLNVLLIGSDSRDGANAAYGTDEGARGDVTILLHLAADRSRAVGVSIPRDSMVQVPECVGHDGRLLPADLAIFNSAYERGGSACTIRTLESLTGIRIDHHVVVDFQGFKTMVDALGTIPICLPRPVEDEKAGLKLPAGRQQVGGEQALAFVRARYGFGGGDIGRIERQQKFLAAMVQKATSTGVLANPARLYGFLDAATRSVTTSPELANLNELRKLTSSVQDIGLSNIEFVTVPWEPYPPNRNRLQWSADASRVWAALRQDRPLPGRPGSGDGAAARAAVSVSVSPRSVRVRVLNGSGRTGLASATAAELRNLGFLVPQVSGADRSDYATTLVRHDPAYGAAARTVAAAVPGARTEGVPGLGPALELVLGRDFTGTQAVRVAGSSPAPAPSPVPSIRARTADQDVCS